MNGTKLQIQVQVRYSNTKPKVEISKYLVTADGHVYVVTVHWLSILQLHRQILYSSFDQRQGPLPLQLLLEVMQAVPPHQDKRP